MMTAWLQGEICGGATGSRSRGVKRIYFRVRFTCPPVPTASHYSSVMHQNATYPRIGAGAIEPFFGKPQSLGHIAVVSG